MERFKIFPSVGIARVGNSADKFYLCAETPDTLGIEIDPAGNEVPLKNFKESPGKIKRQGARFRVYELNSLGEYVPADMNTISVKWIVQLVNKKAGCDRPQEPERTFRPNKVVVTKANLVIDGGVQTISGKNTAPVKFDKGKFNTTPVYLGELRTDKQGNLIVLGGHGRSASPSGNQIGNYYYTPDWFDDTSDGYVKAEVTLPDGTKEVLNTNAWVIVAPPDFAPAVKGVVTLYDTMQQVAFSAGWLTEKAQPSFVHDILPVINRFKNLQWVHEATQFTGIPETDLQLSQADDALRTKVKNRVLSIRTPLAKRLRPREGFELTAAQQNVLTKWQSGNFVNDFNANHALNLPAADLLNKVVLESTVGMGFYPGIEGGIITTKPGIYSEPFRFKEGDVDAGDITAYMALPWQADFSDCKEEWWPSQRPDRAMRNGNFEAWDEGVETMSEMVENFNRLGFIKPNGNAMVESERDPTL